MSLKWLRLVVVCGEWVSGSPPNFDKSEFVWHNWNNEQIASQCTHWNLNKRLPFPSTILKRDLCSDDRPATSPLYHIAQAAAATHGARSAHRDATVDYAARDPRNAPREWHAEREGSAFWELRAQNTRFKLWNPRYTESSADVEGMYSRSWEI